MKIRIEIDEKIQEEEVIIRSPVLDERIRRIQTAVAEAAAREKTMSFLKGDTEYYLPLRKILFLKQTETRFMPIQPMMPTRANTGFMS